MHSLFDKQFATTIIVKVMMNKLFNLDAMFTLIQSLALKIFDLLTITHSDRLNIRMHYHYSVYKVLGCTQRFKAMRALAKMLHATLTF